MSATAILNSAVNVAQFVTLSSGAMQFSEAQASAFAKGVAGDFNPIHDVGGKRFCVPGDLLFAVLLHRYGVYQQMHVDLASMLGADIDVPLPTQLSRECKISDTNDRHLLTLTTAGGHSTDAGFIEQLTFEYVRFSGKTFPDILVTLMREHNVMINPARPLVIYKDMSIHLDKIVGGELSLALSAATLDVDGKKGTAELHFNITSAGEQIGTGQKNMLLSGLRDYDEQAMNNIVEQYNEWKRLYRGNT